MRRGLLGVMAFGCAPAPPPADPAPQVDLVPPSIVSTSLECDAEEALWTLEIVTDAWTGGAVTHWTRDAAYVERHRVQSVEMADDGTRDELLLELAVVDDWREASPGSSTSFTCGSGPNVLLLVQDTTGEAVDCRSWGDPAIWDQVDGLAPCL